MAATSDRRRASVARTCPGPELLFKVECVFVHGQSDPPRILTATWSVSKGPLPGHESLNRDLEGQVRQGVPFRASRGAVASRGDFLPAMTAYIFCWGWGVGQNPEAM